MMAVDAVKDKRIPLLINNLNYQFGPLRTIYNIYITKPLSEEFSEFLKYVVYYFILEAFTWKYY